MQMPDYAKPGLWGVVGGAVAMLVAGFWGMGWTTAGSAERASRERADAAVVTALVPFCVAKAQLDGINLAKFHAEASSYSRSQMVSDAGWARLAGEKSSDYALSRACSERLDKNKPG